MRKDLTIYALAILLGFVMGLFTCKTCTKPQECPPVLELLEGGDIVASDTTTTIRKDSAHTSKPQPERVTLPTLAQGQVPQVIYKPAPVYMPADTQAIIEQYKAMYPDHYALRQYRNRYPFGGDTVEVTNKVQGNELWDQEVMLSHADRTITNIVRAPKRNEVWWGADGGYQPKDTVLWVGTSLDFLQKKGWGARVAISANTRGQWMASGGMKWKIGRR